MIRFTIAGEPRGKGRPRFSRKQGIAYTPAETRNYEATIRVLAQQAMAGRPPIDGPVSVIVQAHLPIPKSWTKKKGAAWQRGDIYPDKRPDLDNIVKAVTDACNGVVFSDDSAICFLWAEKHYGLLPHVSVQVEPVGHARESSTSSASTVPSHDSQSRTP